MFKWPWQKEKEAQVAPFKVKLVIRKASSKRGIHSNTIVMENVVKVTEDKFTPFVYFLCTDGNTRGIHRDRLLEWESILPGGG